MALSVAPPVPFLPALPSVFAAVGLPRLVPARDEVTTAPFDTDGLVTSLYVEQGAALVRLVRLFVDDRTAAEDIVQEAFIRLARAAHRIDDRSRAAAYLRSIALNLARDHNRRGLVSLRQRLPGDPTRGPAASPVEDELALREDHRAVVEALRALPHRQRDCLVLRYYDELGIDDIAAVLGVSRNSVKTHLTRGMRTLGVLLDRGRRDGPDLPAAGGAGT